MSWFVVLYVVGYFAAILPLYRWLLNDATKWQKKVDAQDIWMSLMLTPIIAIFWPFFTIYHLANPYVEKIVQRHNTARGGEQE